jgi:hypothetical protein
MSYALKQSFLFIGLLCCICLFSSGCSTSSEHAEHADHEIPEHRPRDFPHAVKRIRHRLAQFTMLIEVRDAELAAKKFKELQDIVRWLPELAGESDLPEAEWNEVQQISRSLQTSLATIGNDLDKLGVESWKRFTADQESTLTQLDKLSHHTSFQIAIQENEP